MGAKKFEYKFIYDPEHPNASSNGCVYEHVLVAEKILGRHLNKEETVHHIDGNKKNNDPDNLMIFATNGDHIAYHTGMQAWSNNNIWYTARKTEAKICPICKKVFITKYVGKREQVFCSNYCAKSARSQQQNKNSKITYNTIDEKIQNAQKLLYENNGNFSAVARIFGVSSSGLAKLLKKHNLPHHSKNYRNIGM